MKNKYFIIAIALGILLVIPTVKEGIAVIMGKEQTDMIVLPWLVYYNVSMALFSLIAVFTIFKNYASKQNFSMVVLSGHLLVLLILIGIYFTSGSVATKSIMAMTVRSTIWGIINFLVWKGNQKESKSLQR